MVVYAGFMYMESSGNSEKLKKAHALLTFSLIGFGIVIASYVIVKLIGSILNINNVPL